MAYNVNGTYISYDGDAYREAVSRVRSFAAEIAKRDPGLIVPLRGLVQAVIDASREICHPLIDSEKLQKVLESANDYRTDIEGLKKLPEIL